MLDDESHGVFQGKIVVKPDAQKTDAKMMTRALLLTDEAEADAKPELEIFADDVVCGHGATTSAPDKGLKFYLMSRGITEPEAEALLIQAFIGEVVEEIGNETIREALMNAAIEWMGSGDETPSFEARYAGTQCGERQLIVPWSRRREPRRATVKRTVMHPAVTNGALDIDRIRADFPALAMQVYGKPLVYLDNAASAQKPQAVLDRINKAYTELNTPTCTAACITSPTRRPRPMRARARPCRSSSTPAARKRSSSPATSPRPSTWSPIPSGASASRPATRSCSRSWSTIPTSCRGISCASVRARC